jgi:hypothetical protein
LEQIAKAVTQMERVTQQTAASAEESASAAEELTAQSEAVKEVLQHLSAMIGGESAGPRRARELPGQSARPVFRRASGPMAPASQSAFPLDDDL